MRCARRLGPMRSAALAAALAATASCSPPSSDPNARIGRVDAMDGEAVLVHAGDRRAAAVGAPIRRGDVLETGATGKVQITLTDQSTVAIGPKTRLEMSEYAVDATSRTGRLAIASGRFWMHVKKWTKGGESLYEVSTPHAVAGVRGTTLWGDTDVDAICALEGSIEVRSLKHAGLSAAVLSAGNCASQLSQGKLEPLAPTRDELDRYLAEVLIPSAPRETR